MRIHLVNPSDVSFGVAIITPRWLFVLAAATPPRWGDPVLTDETLEAFDPAQVESGDVVGIGIPYGECSARLRGRPVGSRPVAPPSSTGVSMRHCIQRKLTRSAGRTASSVVMGIRRGPRCWMRVRTADRNVSTRRAASRRAGLRPARWDILQRERYMWASVQTVRGCPKHCSFCSVWRSDGQEPRQRTADVVVQEIVELRRMGFRFIALADDNFYPVTLSDLATAARRADPQRLRELEAIRAERFELMAQLAQLPDDLVFYTQITMEAAEDPEFLLAMKQARIRGALVGIESVTPEGLKDIYKEFNVAGDELVERLRQFRQGGLAVLGSFIFGLPSDRSDTFEATAALAERADVPFAQFVMLTPLPGTLDFDRWEEEQGEDVPTVNGIPLTRYWLIPPSDRPKVYVPHPVMAADEVRQRTQVAWDHFYRLTAIWRRSRIVGTVRERLAFVLVSKLYRQMYANTGIATDSARVSRATGWARWLARPLQRLFAAPPRPDLQMPRRNMASP